MSMPGTLRPRSRLGFSVPDRSRVDLLDARGDARVVVVVTRPVGARALADELGEPRGEGAEGGTADLEADLGDAEVAASEESLGALDPSGHEVAVGRLAEGGPEAAGEVAWGHESDAGQGGHVQRLGVVAVHGVPGAA